MRSPFSAHDGLVRVYPAAAGPLQGSALLWVHGGAFRHGGLDMPEADAVAQVLAERGATVASVDYRLAAADGSGRFPAGSDDVISAWSWLLANAAELGADAGRLFAGGASAGANLVTGAVLRMLGHAPISTNRTVPAGVILAYPTLLAVQPAPTPQLRAQLDALPDADRFGPDAVRAMYENYLGEAYGSAPLAAIPGLASAADVAGFPATLMVNSDTDELRMSGELFAHTLHDAGVSVTSVTEPDTWHGHLNRPEEPGFARTIARVVDWMAARG